MVVPPLPYADVGGCGLSPQGRSWYPAKPARVRLLRKARRTRKRPGHYTPAYGLHALDDGNEEDDAEPCLGGW